MVRTWLRYPFAVAGPWALALYGFIALANVLNALVVAGDGQFWVLLGTIVVAYAVVEAARHRFASRRGVAAPPVVSRRSAVFYLPPIAAALLVAALLGLSDGWYGVLAAAALAMWEIGARIRWEASGRPGDAQWARDWSEERPRGA